MADSVPTALGTPIVDGGIWSVNFFNGRLLSADTLSDEQTANRTARLQLGKALGSGVAYGLEVTEHGDPKDPLAPVVRVAPGLAVNRLGQTLELTELTDLALRREDAVSTTTVDALDFSDCSGAGTGGGSYRTGSGVFVLAIGPSAATSGRALVSGLGNGTAACATKYSIEGIQFRLVRVNADDALLADAALVRNRIAYRFLGTASPARRALERDPFAGPVASYGIDDLWNGCLDTREVPLALIYWTAAGGIEFVDRWAVRRRLAPAPASGAWPLLAGARAQREGEAMLLQFQDHLADLRATRPSPSALRASDWFERLPPAGLVPLESGTAAGFAVPPFFAGLVTRGPFVTEEAKAVPLLRTALSMRAIELDSKRLIWLYQVHENRDPVVPGSGLQRPYALFTTGDAPYAANAQFDLAYWDFANYALRVT